MRPALSSRSSRSFSARAARGVVAITGVLAMASLAPTACAPPPGDFLNGPAYGNSDPLVAAPQSEVKAPPAPAILSAADVAVGRRVLSLAITRALGTDGVNVYFGDDIQNALLTLPEGSATFPSVVERPAPVAIAIDGRSITWIGKPGNIVRRVSRTGAKATTLREGATFTAIAASRGETFIAEMAAKGSVLSVIRAGAMRRLASLDVPVRAVVVDDASIYVVTASAVMRMARGGGTLDTMTSGHDLAYPQLDRDNLYVTAEDDVSRSVLRIPKAGGETELLVHGVRDAPIALFGDQVYYFVDSQPELRHVSTNGGPATLAVRDEALEWVSALAVDQLRMVVGTERAGIIAYARNR